MARKPLTPWYRAERKAWFITLAGKQINLGPDKHLAERRFHELMARKGEEELEVKSDSPPAVSIIDRFLEWCLKHRARRTYTGYKEHLQSFIDSLVDKALSVGELKPFHVQEWVDAHESWGPTFTRNAITAVQRAFAWAEKMGHLDKSPLRYVEKPTPKKREQVVPEAHYKAMLEAVRDQSTRDLLAFAWETGARPQETRSLEARHYSSERQRFELAPEEAKGGKRWRIIYLTETALGIVTRLVKEHAKGSLFLNCKGQPWTAWSIDCLFKRLAKKLKVKYTFYAFRHTYCQRLLEAGMDSVTVAGLMGHANAQMVHSTYSHMGQAHGFLLEQLKKARCSFHKSAASDG